MAPIHRNAVLFIGLNPDAAAEARELEKHCQVIFIGNSKKADQIMIGGHNYDLATPEGRKAALAKLMLSNFQLDAVNAVLGDAYRNSRDELGKLAVAWARYERTNSFPNRMVISAHHAGSLEFWGQDNGTISFEQLKKLAQAFPKAAAAVQHMHFSACYSGDKMMRWPGIFRNLVSMWAYSGSAPGSMSGASLHLRIWEKQTRGNSAGAHRSGAKKTRKGDNVTVWSRIYGTESDTIESIQALRSRESNDRRVFTDFFNGDQLVVDTDVCPLRDYYNTVMALLNHVDLTEAERPALEKKRDVTVRLIFYQKEIRAKFQQAYRAEIEAGYSALKLKAPNFATLDRKQALSAINEFRQNAGARPLAAVAQCLQLLTNGLRDLSSEIIPLNWV